MVISPPSVIPLPPLFALLLVLLLLVAFPPVRDGFSHAVYSILQAFGQPYYGPSEGQHEFMFWQSQ